MSRAQTLAGLGLGLCLAGIMAAGAAEDVKGDPAQAVPVVEKLCAACHGLDGNSPISNIPKLAGQHPEYLLKELKAYQAEHRVSAIMAPLAKQLGEDDLANLAAYFARQKPAPGTVSRPELLALGKKLYLDGNSKSGVPACDGCHEEDGSGSKRFPRVAGQHVDYTLEELKRYAAGQRAYGTKLMRTVAERLTPEEAQALAQYLASLK